MLNRDEQVALLISAGIMPSVAEWLVAEDIAADHAIVGTRKAKGMAKISDVDVEAAAAAWYVNPAIPDEFKRILDARTFPAEG